MSAISPLAAAAILAVQAVIFAIGQVLFTTAVVTAYDYMLDQPDLLGIDVVNNSWGNSYRQYDPRDPVAVATKAVADQGVTVVFAVQPKAALAAASLRIALYSMPS